MDFKTWWELAQRMYDTDATPANVAGALGEAWMADGRAEYRKRFAALMASSELSNADTLIIDELPVMVGGELAAAIGGGITYEVMDSGRRVYKMPGPDDPADALGSLHALMIAVDNQPLPNRMPVNLHELTNLISDPAKVSAMLLLMSAHFRMRALRDNSTAELTAALTHGFQVVHTLWESIATTLKHPLAALIEDWLQRPIDPDDRKTAILPAAVGRIVVTETSAPMFELFANDDVVPGFVSSPDLQAYLPDLAPQSESDIGPALPLQLWDAAAERSPGGQTPLDLRMWVEGITAIPTSERLGRRRIQVAFGDLVEWLMPNGRYNRNSWPAMQRAFHRVHNWRIPWEQNKVGGLWAAVRIVSGPRYWNAYRDPVIFDIDLPPGVKDKGPILYRPALRRYGQQTAMRYRGYLGLTWLWDRYGATHGRYIQPMRRRIARDTNDYQINKQGEIIPGEDGKPAHTYMIKDNRTGKFVPRPGIVFLDADGYPVPEMKQAAMERNPAADRYPILRPEQLVALSYPVSLGKRLTPAAIRKRRERARAAVMQIAADGYAVIEDIDGGLRILPPLGWGAGFSE